MEEKKITRAEIDNHFSANNKVKVVFTKKDGSERTMICTKDMGTIPEEFRPSDDSRKQAKPMPEHLMSVFDLEANGWRSFTVANVTSIETAL